MLGLQIISRIVQFFSELVGSVRTNICCGRIKKFFFILFVCSFTFFFMCPVSKGPMNSLVSPIHSLFFRNSPSTFPTLFLPDPFSPTLSLSFTPSTHQTVTLTPSQRFKVCRCVNVSVCVGVGPQSLPPPTPPNPPLPEPEVFAPLSQTRQYTCNYTQVQSSPLERFRGLRVNSGLLEQVLSFTIIANLSSFL